MVDKPAFKMGDYVEKISGSSWRGRVVGTYSTDLTPEGYAVESDTEKGSVQIYPAKALRLATPANGEQVEWIAAIARDLIPSYEDRAGGYDKTLEVLRFAATLSTPTEDARSRVKVLEEALEWYAREFSWRSSTVYMCGHSGPSSAEIDRGQRARTALGNKETDRHG